MQGTVISLGYLSARPFDSPRSVPRLDVRPPGDERVRSAT